MNADSTAAKERKQPPVLPERSLLLRRHDAIVARGRVGDRWVRDFYGLRDRLNIGELQPTAGA